jgi:hypothetical protein
MEKWEYLTLTVDATAIDAKLSELGDQGWELVSFVPAKFVGLDWTQAGSLKRERTYVSNEYRLVFKRRKQ